MLISSVHAAADEQVLTFRGRMAMRIRDTHETAAEHFDYLDEAPGQIEVEADRALDEPADADSDLEDLIGAPQTAQPAAAHADLRTA